MHDNLESGYEKLTTGDYQAALALADAALTQDALSLAALQLRSRALYLLGRDEEALQTLRRVAASLHEIVLPEMEDDPDALPTIHDPLSRHFAWLAVCPSGFRLAATSRAREPAPHAG